MAHKKEIQEIDGYYIASSLPKAFFMPSSVSFRSRDNVRELKKKVIQKKESKMKFEVRPETLGIDFEECLPVEGRQHLAIQTDVYLEEICDVVEEVDAQTETDPSIDRPPSPLFIPLNLGVDIATQIYPGELFDFDEEVEPILEILVEQTLEQAIIEIMAEEELAMLAESQMDLEAKRNSELIELKRLEEEERRILEEKKKQLKEQEEAITLEDELAQKVAASVYSQNYLSELVPQVYEKLDAGGYFETEEPEMNDMEENFWPWLLNEVDSEIATLEASSQLLEKLIQDNTKDIVETSFMKPEVENSDPEESHVRLDEITESSSAESEK